MLTSRCRATAILGYGNHVSVIPPTIFSLIFSKAAEQLVAFFVVVVASEKGS